jgi:hypothetical protein
MTCLVPALATALFAEKTRALACRGYDPKLKAFMKKAHANVRFASADFCRSSTAHIDRHEFRFVS